MKISTILFLFAAVIALSIWGTFTPQSYLESRFERSRSLKTFTANIVSVEAIDRDEIPCDDGGVVQKMSVARLTLKNPAMITAMTYGGTFKREEKDFSTTTLDVHLSQRALSLEQLRKYQDEDMAFAYNESYQTKCEDHPIIYDLRLP